MSEEASPELVVQTAYLLAFRRLRRGLLGLALAVLVIAGVGGWAIYSLGVEQGRSYTNQQIRLLACGVVNQIPPGDPLTDYVRVTYRCGSYNPHTAVIQPKK
jgi:hypothetical protein